MKHKVFEHKLSSGASGLVVDVPGSAVVNLRVTFHSGFQFAKTGSYEVPHIMEHLLATVTKRHSRPNAFIIDAQRNGAYVNASTSAETNEYIYECAAFELERILGLIEEQICEPLFAEAPFEAERSNVREELTRNTTQHGSVCAIKLAEQAAPKLWLDYPDRIKQLDSIKLEELQEHYGATHTAANARFYAAGHFPDGGKELAARFEGLFGRLPRGRRLGLVHDIGLGNSAPIVTHRDIDQLYYRTGVYFGELDEQGRAVFSLLRMLLVGGMGSRVLGEARRRGLAYGVGGVAYSEPGNSAFGFSGYVTPKNAGPLFEVMARNVAGVADGQVTGPELKAAKDLLVGSVMRSTQTASDILQWYVDRYDDEGVIHDFDQGLKRIGTVTVDEIVELMGTVASSRRRGVSLLGRLNTSEAAGYNEVLQSA